MARTSYAFTKAVASTQLETEIRASVITTALDSIALDGTDVLTIWFKDALSSGDEAILSGLVTSHVIAPHTIVPESVIITSQPDPAPFAQPTYRTKRAATTNLVSIAVGDNSDVAFVLTSERYVNGGCLIVENAEIGDYIVAEVEDVNGVIPAPYRAALCENYPVVSTYIEKEFVRVMTPGTVQSGAITVHEINTAPLNAKISANLCLCVHYYAVNSGLTRRLAINYHLTKKL